MSTLIDHWIFLGLGLCLLYLPYFLWRGGRDRLMALFVACLGMIQLHSLTGSEWTGWLHQVALYPVAPLLYLYFLDLQGESVSRERVLRHLWPTGLAALSVTAGAIRPAWSVPVLQAVYGLSFLGGTVYAVLILRRLHRLSLPAGLMRAEALMLSLVALAGLGIAVLVVLGGLLEAPGFFKLYGSLITVLMVLGHGLILRFPQIPEVLADELQDALAEAGPAVRRSQLAGVDVEEATAALRRQMEEDHVYRRFDLSLPVLAERTGVTPHQLSELVNTRLGMNYARLVKGYRVAEAKMLLLAEPQRSALDIGLSVGFTSLSAFYAAFRELEGMAPGQYRKQGSSSPTP